MNLKLWYAKPASKWVEALPIGNGRLGAMIHGGTASELLSLNDEFETLVCQARKQVG